MTLRKKIKSRFKLMLRRLGMICKKPQEPARRIRISKTLNPDGTVTYHHRLSEQPLTEDNIETRLHIHTQIKNLVKKNK
jgi:hypothetical protein